MEGKERFTDLHYLDNQIFVYDNKLKSKRVIGIEECFELLNQQDVRIKELEKIRDKGNQKLENFYNEKIDKLDSDYNKHFNELIEENQQLEEKLNNFETCMKKYNVEDIEHLDLMLFVLSSETKYHLKEIKDKHKKELKQAQKQLAIEELKLTLDNFRNRPTYFDVARQELCLSEQDKQFIDFINNRIKELGGEENNDIN